MFTNNAFKLLTLFTILGAGLLLTPQSGQAHCDSMDGPVVRAAQKALKTGDVSKVLIWVNEPQEEEIRQSFRETLQVRDESKQIREVVDRYFYETVVRLHRESEGAAYTGLKSAGTDFGPAIPAAEGALKTGSLQEVRDLLVEELEKGLHHFFDPAYEAKEFDSGDVEAGREYVHNYVEFLHYIEPVFQALQTDGAAHSH